MAYLLVPLNGIGRGHLTRSLILAEWLRESGRLPMIALQGNSRFSASATVPTANIPSIYRIPEDQAQRIGDDLAHAALMSSPSVIIEDTHPRRVRWPREIQHILIVRPTRIDHMRLLENLHGSTILVCDHPDSPTWPYHAAETAEIASWPNWTFLGPIYRPTKPDEVERVRARYRLAPDESLFVFSMGGGGEVEGSGDRLAFVEVAGALARRLRECVPRPRLVFVRGPLFPIDIELPEMFEDIREEPDLPALLQLATGAVVRPGYNITWECIAARTPFIAVRGTTFNEPVQVRLEALSARGFETSPDVDRLLDPEARERFIAACDETLHRFDGSPRELFLAHATAATALVAHETKTVAAEPASDMMLSSEQLEQLASAVRGARAPVPLRIRIDDVTRLDTELRWLLSLCRELGAKASLAIVPYHNTITGDELDRLDPDGAIEVSQHGYAHLPDYLDGFETRGEFVRDSHDKAHEQLRVGFQLLGRAFGERFRHGYSAPYDLPPAWISSVWRAVGGRHLSWIYQRPARDELPTVRLAVDPWNWRAGQPRPGEDLVDRLESAIAHDEGIGLVFHPRCLRHVGHRQTAEALLRCLVEARCVPTDIAPVES